MRAVSQTGSRRRASTWLLPGQAILVKTTPSLESGFICPGSGMAVPHDRSQDGCGPDSGLAAH